MTCRSVKALTTGLLLLTTSLAAAVPGNTPPGWSLTNPQSTEPSRVKDRPPPRVHPIQRTATPIMAGGPVVEREVMGYLPYWEMDYDFPRWD
ncbi:MAG: hypothetical protein VX938_13035, partial [Myxococcota bacterium]|nr:hypothetical protein [Myxococcota bacterium]